MKLGIVSAIYDGFTFEEMIDHASSVGYECVEVACWPQGKAERRAGADGIAVRILVAQYQDVICSQQTRNNCLAVHILSHRFLFSNRVQSYSASESDAMSSSPSSLLMCAA